MNFPYEIQLLENQIKNVIYNHFDKLIKNALKLLQNAHFNLNDLNTFSFEKIHYIKFNLVSHNFNNLITKFLNNYLLIISIE